MSVALLFDEHLRGPLFAALRRYSDSDEPIDVQRVGDPPDLPLGSDDPAILAWAEREGRVLVSLDEHTLIAHWENHLASGRSSPGILILRRRRTIQELVDCLATIAVAGEPHEFRDRLTYIP